MVLLQTLVISVILSLISVMVLKWIMGRYMMAARNYRFVTTTARASGLYQLQFPNWTTSLPAPGSYGPYNIDTQYISYTVTNIGTTRRIDIVSDKDQ